MTAPALRAAKAAAGFLPLTLLVGALPGLAGFQLAHPDALAGLGSNALPSPLGAAAWVVASALLWTAGCAAAHALVGRRRGLDLASVCARANLYGSALAVVPIYLFLTSSPTIGAKHPFFSILACLGAAAIGARVAYRTGGIGRLLAPRPEPRPRDLLPLLVVLALVAAYATAVGHFGLLHHRNLGTRGWDLGIYVNSMWHTLRGEPLACSILSEGNHAYRHFDPIIALLSPLLLVRESAETLIVFQSLWAASGALPLYLLGRKLLGNGWAGALLAAAWLLHPALHGPSIYDFHSLFLAGPLALWCLCCLEHGWTKRYFAALTLFLLCREEIPVLGVLIGVHALISGKPRRVGIATITISAVYGAAVYFAVVVHAASYDDYFEEMGGQGRPVLGNILLTLVTNPAYLAQYALAEPKVVYILKLAAPLLLLPLLARKHWVLFLLGLGVTLFGSKKGFFDISMQYSAWWLPFLFASVPAAIVSAADGRPAARLGVDPGRLRGALLAGVLLCTLLMSATYGIFWPNHPLRAGYEELTREPTGQMEARYETVLKIKEMIPKDASVWTTSHLAAHFAARDRIWVIDIINRRDPLPDYYVVWWTDAQSRKDERRRSQDRMLEPVRRPHPKYRLLMKENGISVFRKK